MADHAGTAAHGPFCHRPGAGRRERLVNQLGIYMLAPDVVQHTIVGLHHHRHAPVGRRVRQGRMLMGNQRVTYHADTVGVGGRNRRRQQACFPNPFKASGITIAVQHMAAGEAWLITRRCGAWLDDADTRAYRFAVMDLVQRCVADPHTRYVGNCVVGSPASPRPRVIPKSRARILSLA